MKDTATITGLEEKYKKLLLIKLGADKRLAVNSPSSKYPEPAFVYVKSVKTEKVIAIRLDGEDHALLGLYRRRRLFQRGRRMG